jgi:glucan phosphoethanolaminetransferase (alkaline phosphatase superfamily)
MKKLEGINNIKIFFLLVASLLYECFILSLLWKWFIVPLGVIEINMAHVLGIYILFYIFKGGDCNLESTDDYLNNYLSIMIKLTISLTIGYILSFWI